MSEYIRCTNWIDIGTECRLEAGHEGLHEDGDLRWEWKQESADPVRCPKCGGPHPFHDPACVVHPDLIQDHTDGSRDA